MNTTAKVFIHDKALCESDQIGAGTRVWAFAHILPGARIGRDCNICDGVFIENDVVLGDRVTIKTGVQVWDGVTIEDDVFIGPGATFTNDRFPRSKRYPEHFLKTVIRRGASIGANATILPGLEIAESAMIGAGAVVTRDVPAKAIAVGNPAKIVGYVDTPNNESFVTEINSLNSVSSTKLIKKLGVKGCSLWQFPHYADLRGDITVSLLKEMPFDVKRIFFVYGVPSDRVRGEHAHRSCAEMLLAVHGSVSVIVDDGSAREEVRLDKPTIGLCLAAQTWTTQYRFTKDAVVAVYASEPYNAQGYVRTYKEFLELIDDKQ